MKIQKIFKSSVASTAILASLISGASIVSLTNTAYAQDYSSGEIRGTVYLGDGSAATSGTVTVKSIGRGFTRNYKVRSDGGFSFGRLPIGDYEVTANSGGNSSKPESAHVSVGKTLQVFLVVSSGSKNSSGDEIVVYGERQKASKFEVATTGLTLDVSATFAKVPLARSLTSLSLLAPKTSAGDSAFGNLASISGSSVAENAYYINGMNITDFRNFVGAASVPFEFYDQVSTKTGGFAAEFGRSTGGVVNAVTKSGSNEFHYGTSVYYSPEALSSAQSDTFYGLNTLEKRNNWEANLWVSGPIWKDRAFFYLLYSPRSREYDNYATSGLYTKSASDDPFWGGKIDINITNNHLLEFTAFSDRRDYTHTKYKATYSDNRSKLISVDKLTGVTTNENGGNVFIGKYTGKITDFLTISALYGEQTIAQTSKSDNDDNPVIYDATSGSFKRLGNWNTFRIEVGDDKRELMRFDADILVNNFFGDHAFRLGYDKETLTAKATTKLSGGIYYLYYNPKACEKYGGAAGQKCIRVRDYSLGGEFATDQTAFYIQDAWDVNDRLTVNLGLRSDSFDNKNAAGKTFVNIKNQIAPRVSASLALSEDGSLSTYASYGKYYLPVATNTNIRMAGNETYIHRYYQLISRNSDDTPNYDANTLFKTTITGDGSVADTRAIKDVNLDPMFANELILGLKKSFDSGKLEGWEFDVNYSFRTLGSTIEDIAIDRGVLAYCKAKGIAGCADVWGGFHQYVLTNPGEDLRVWIPENDAKKLTDADGNPFKAQYVDITSEQLGYPTVSRLFDALEVGFAKATDIWSIKGSYTLSRSYGNYEGSVKSDNGQDDAGLTQDFDQPGLTDGAKGLLPNHHAHIFKAWGSYAVTDALNIGTNLLVSSPRHFGCRGVHPYDDFAADYGVASWYCNGKLTPRGKSFKSDWVYKVDLTVSYLKSFSYGDLTLRADIFNIFNNQAITDLDEDGEIAKGTINKVYGLATSYQSPRSVRIGISWEY